MKKKRGEEGGLRLEGSGGRSGRRKQANSKASSTVEESEVSRRPRAESTQP